MRRTLDMRDWSTLANVCSAYLERSLDKGTTEAIISLRDRCLAQRDAISHSSDPDLPEGFTRYRIGMDVPDGIDIDDLCCQAQQFAVDVIDNSEIEHPGQRVIDAIENRVTVEAMEG